MVEWEKVKVGDIGKVITGKTPKTSNSEYYGGNIPFLTPSDDMSVKYVRKTNKYITEIGRLSIKNATLPANAICVSCIGSDLGKVVITTQKTVTNQQINSIVVDTDKFDIDFVYYSMLELGKILNFHSKTSTAVPIVNKSSFSQYEIDCPKLNTQKKIGAILSSIDNKIEENNQINKNLEQQAQALYREMFVNTTNDHRRTCRAEEYFDIAIGKTPPRKEHQWFTTNPSDVTWVSISDMGSCGTYISRSSEQLTQEAVDKFNIKVVPSNTVLLSFKLTIGRIAITHGEMTTNEAIAHFKTDKPFINEYLYCYLRDFNYQTMGSTSSIAIAVNSKIIKAMPFVIPADDEISRFHSVVGPMFEQILNNQLENDSLADLRDTLLPRLMSGELDVSNLDL